MLVHVQAGSGHRQAAIALSKAAAAEGVPAEVRDALGDIPAFLRKPYEGSYATTARHLPAVWQLLYDRSDRIPVRHGIHLVRAALDRFVLGRLRGEVVARPPAAVVCTHFLPALALADLRRRGRLRAPLHVVVTDYGAHSFWAVPGVDLYHVASEAAARDLVRLGVDPSRVRLSGIPVDPAFAEAARRRSAIRAGLGVADDRPVVLLTAGSDAVTRIEDAVAGFRAEGPKLIVVCGKSEETRRRVESVVRARDLDAVVTGYTTNMPQFLAAADLAVTKPGGLTVTESLVAGTPMLLAPGIPGQESRNAEFLLEAGAAVALAHISDAAARVHEILGEPGRLRRMREAARRHARPDAAREIVRAAMGHPTEITTGATRRQAA